ncbi:hypothetical protein HG530_008964 [Fusarium avenaceum]|nr:hypothetical protein HG530_008964 [Fusarium avenaceum]
MAKIAGIMHSRLVACAQLNDDLKILHRENLGRSLLVNLLRLTIHKQLKLGRTICGDERNIRYKPLANNPSAHDDSRVLIANSLVRSASHIGRIFKPSGAGDGIRIARIDDHTSQPSVLLLLEKFPAVSHGRSLEFVLGEDTSSCAGTVRGDEGDVGLASVSRLDTSQDARSDEALGIFP